MVGGTAELLERLLGRQRGLHVVTASGEQTLDREADGTLVVDDQDPALHDAALRARGSSIRNTIPVPGARAASIRPPWASMVRLAMASPSPVPLALSEKNGSKRRGRTSAATPGPLSSTRTLAVPLSAPTTRERRLAPATSPRASIAFSSRLTSTCRSLSWSARAMTPLP